MHRNIDCSDAEWQARLDLAACYRIFDMLGWSEWIYNHISLRVPGERHAFLINPYGLLYSEVCASNLVKIDIAGKVLDGSPYPVNQAGFLFSPPPRLGPCDLPPPHHCDHGRMQCRRRVAADQFLWRKFRRANGLS